MPYGLDYGVVIEMAKALDIESDQTFFEKIRAFESEVLRIWKDKGHCDEKQKERCKIEFGDFFEWACKNCERKKEEGD